MFKVEDLKDEISKLKFIRCSSLLKVGYKHNFKLNSEEVVSKILTNFANRYLLSLETLRQLIDNYNDEIVYSINEAIFGAVDTIINNSIIPKKNWNIEDAIWIAILQDNIINELREIYFEMTKGDYNDRTN